LSPWSCCLAMGDAYRCCLTVEEPFVEEFKQLVDLLRRNGFQEVPHQLVSNRQDGGEGLKPFTKLVADGQGLWTTCMQAVLAYESRGRRLQQALLGERTEDRRKRDGRVYSLLQENSRLQEELQAARSSQMRSPDVSFGSPVTAQSTSGCQSPARLGPLFQAPRDRQLQEMTLRAQKAEAGSRQHERELEKLKARMEQLLAETAKRKDRERAAMTRASRKVGRDENVEAVIAHKAATEAAQAEASSLRKQVHTLGFQLEEAEAKIRRLEAVSKRAVPQAEEVPEMSACEPEALAEERERRANAEEQLKDSHLKYAEQINQLTISCKKAEEQAADLKAQLRERTREPARLDCRLQREVLKLREELAEVRKAWKTTDTRSLIQRDKELRRLGLDVQGLEDMLPKADMAALLIELCRLLQLRSAAELVPEADRLVRHCRSLADAEAATCREQATLLQLAEVAMQGMQDIFGAMQPLQAVAQIREVFAAAQKQQSNEEVEKVWRNLARKLKFPEDASAAQLSANILDMVDVHAAGKKALGEVARSLQLPDDFSAGQLCSKIAQLVEAQRASEKACNDLTSRLELPDGFSWTQLVDAVVGLLIAQKENKEAWSTVARSLQLPDDSSTRQLCSHIGQLVDAQRANEQVWKAASAELQLPEGTASASCELLEKLSEVVQTQRDNAKVWAEVAHGLQLPHGTPAGECLDKIAEMVEASSDQVALLNTLSSTLRCSKAELHTCAQDLVQSCDEHLAAHRIVEVLQKLLNVSNIAEVLPALKEVLDVTMLRQKISTRASQRRR